MNVADVPLALAGFAVGVLGFIWTEEIRELDLKIHRRQPRWMQIPGYEAWLSGSYYLWFVRFLALYVVLLQVSPLLRAWLALRS
jgi:hypothetical protein